MDPLPPLPLPSSLPPLPRPRGVKGKKKSTKAFKHPSTFPPPLGDPFENAPPVIVESNNTFGLPGYPPLLTPACTLNNTFGPPECKPMLDLDGTWIPEPVDASFSYDELDHSDIVQSADEDVKDDETKDEAPLIRRLYGELRKNDLGIDWYGSPPGELQRPKEKKAGNKSTVILYFMATRDDFGLKFPLYSILVKSKSVKDILTKVLGDYPGVDIGRYRTAFHEPFQPIVHRWSELYSAIVGCTDDRARERGLSFFNALKPEIGETVKERDDLISRGLITFDLLWTLYPPKSLVFINVNGKCHLMRIATIEMVPSGKLNDLEMRLEYLDVADKTFIPKIRCAIEFEFSGTRKIIDLRVIPFCHHPEKDRLFAELVQRGKKMVSLVKNGGCKWYRGRAATSFDREEDESTWMEGRIIVDPEEYSKRSCRHHILHEPLSFASVSAAHKLEELTDEQLAMCRSVVGGFSLSTKTWNEFEVDNIKELHWDDHAFDQLVMPGRRKRLMKALVDRSVGGSNSFDDFIKGKGQGLVMLLKGPPGTGKTLTAESIANRVHLPLYAVNASELSHDFRSVEEEMSDLFQRAARWKAVLLIDECDAFLTRRVDVAMADNQRVATFLRLLEYFKGVLILTTNRPLCLDKAFSSRIHLILKFKPLDESERASVWKNFLRNIPNNVHERDVNVLAEMELNGRQIKNVVKMGALLAQSEGQILSMEHIDDVLEVMEIEDDDNDDDDDDYDDDQDPERF